MGCICWRQSSSGNDVLEALDIIQRWDHNLGDDGRPNVADQRKEDNPVIAVKLFVMAVLYVGSRSNEADTECQPDPYDDLVDELETD